MGVVDIFDKDKEGKRVRKQLEVDFVVNQGNQRYYIQVAYDMTSEEKQTQEFNSLRNIPDSFKKIVIVNGSKKPWRNDEGFVIMGIKYFLLNANSLAFYSRFELFVPGNSQFSDSESDSESIGWYSHY